MQADLTGSARRVLLAIVDEVLGFKGRSPSTDSGQGFWAKKTGIRKEDLHRSFAELHAKGWINWEPGEARKRGTATLLRLPVEEGVPADCRHPAKDTGTPYPQIAGTPTRKERAELPADCGQKCPQSAGTIKKEEKEGLFKKSAGAENKAKRGAPGTSSKRLVPSPQVQELPAPEPVQIAETEPTPPPEPPPTPKHARPSFQKPSTCEHALWTAAIERLAMLARRSPKWQANAAGLEVLAWSAGEVVTWHPDEKAGRTVVEAYGHAILTEMRAADPTVSKFTVHTPGGAVSVELTPAEAAI